MHHFGWVIQLKTLHVVTAYINKNDTFLEEAVSKDPSRYVQDELQSNVSSNYIISEDTENTTPSHSISEDSQGRKLSNEQIELNDAPFWAGYSTKMRHRTRCTIQRSNIKISKFLNIFSQASKLRSFNITNTLHSRTKSIYTI